MFVDRRLYNTPRVYLYPPKDWWMLVPRELLNAVVFIGAETGSGEKIVGTGFFVSVDAVHLPGLQCRYLVTARHVVEDKLGLVARVNAKGRGTMRMLLPDGDDPRWVFLNPPEGEDFVDLAALMWPATQEVAEAGYRWVPTTMFFDEAQLTEEVGGVSLGDEVVAVGLLSVHYGANRNEPVVRTGNVAMIPSEPVLVKYKNGVNRRMSLYLTELRSIAGLSGSPVFVTHRAPLGDPIRLSLFGVMIGHWDDPDSNHMGFGKVVPARLLSDLLNQGDEVAKREKLEKDQRDREATAAQDSANDEESEFERFERLAREVVSNPKPNEKG